MESPITRPPDASTATDSGLNRVALVAAPPSPGNPWVPVLALGDPELLVEAQQVLLDRRLRHDEVGRDLPGCRGGHEGLVGKGRAAQGREDVQFAAGQLGARRAPQLDFGGDVLPGDAAHPAARRAEAEHVAFFEDPAGYQPPVDPGPVTR